MKDNSTQATLTNPPTSETKLTNPPSEKLVTVRILRDAKVDGVVRLPGTIVSVPESVAAELCRVIPGQFDFSGERFDAEPPRANLKKAERV